jgi:uncharacterized protein (TIGR03067 family)
MDGKVVLEFNWSIDPKSPIPADAKRMQGKWRAIDFVDDGRVRGTEGVKITVAGDKFTFTGGFGESFTRRLDVFPYDNPKQLNLTKSETEYFPCLYGFVGDRLKLCIESMDFARVRCAATAATEPGFSNWRGSRNEQYRAEPTATPERRRCQFLCGLSRCKGGPGG